MDRQQIRIMALVWGIRNHGQPGKAERSARWFALADRYKTH